RALYNAGVSLVAVSRVDGLEDLFGVKYAPSEVRFYGVDSKDEHEDVFPYTAPARYESDGAEVVLSTEGTPAIFRHNRTVLYNISPAVIGRSYFYEKVENARTSVSDLLYKTSIGLMRELSRPTAFTENGKCGITMFKDTNGNTILLVLDYSEHDQSKLNNEDDKMVVLPDSIWHDAEAIDGKPLRKLIGKDGKLEGVVVNLRHHESALIRLV
ncbi:MAG: hypothetical protein IKL42_01230, partial [Clostridia bacterium]|nr:hypothetical protein [Clostridia bacterium]